MDVSITRCVLHRTSPAHSQSAASTLSATATSTALDTTYYLLLLTYLDSDTPVLPKPPSPATPPHADKHTAVGKGAGTPCRDEAV